MKTMADARRFDRFGSFEIDREACELRRDDQRIPLQIQPFRVLEALIDRAGEVVTRADLRAKIWPSTVFVDFDHGLNSAMTRLRHALGDSSDAPIFIETLPRIGYRFIHPLQREDSWIAPEATTRPEANSGWQLRSAQAALLLIGIFGVALWVADWSYDEEAAASRLDSLSSESPDAREAYLRGIAFYEQRNKEAIEQSIGELTRATETDPLFAIAHAALAKAYVSAGSNNSLSKYLNADDAIGPALSAAERALRLDPGLAQAHWAMAGVLNGLQPWSAATDVAIEQAYRRALELDSSVAAIHLSFGNFLSTRRRSSEAIDQFREARELDPLSPSINSRLGMELVSVGQTVEGLQYLQRTVELYPWQFNAQWRLGWAHIALGNLDAAQTAFQAAERISPESTRSRASLAFIAAQKGDESGALAILSSLRPTAEALNDPFDIAIVYVGLLDQDNAIEWLAKTARQTRTLHMQGPWALSAPIYDWLRGDVRFVEIEREIQASNSGAPDFDSAQ